MKKLPQCENDVQIAHSVFVISFYTLHFIGLKCFSASLFRTVGSVQIAINLTPQVNVTASAAGLYARTGMQIAPVLYIPTLHQHFLPRQVPKKSTVLLTFLTAVEQCLPQWLEFEDLKVCRTSWSHWTWHPISEAFQKVLTHFSAIIQRKPHWSLPVLFWSSASSASNVHEMEMWYMAVQLTW